MWVDVWVGAILPLYWTSRLPVGDVVPMSYLDQGSATGWGCFPAAAFAILIGLPWFGMTLIGECFGEDGVVACPHRGVGLLGLIVALAVTCLVITRATNRLVAQWRERGRISWGWVVALILCFGLGLALEAYGPPW